jgi:hypothetical protein
MKSKRLAVTIKWLRCIFHSYAEIVARSSRPGHIILHGLSKYITWRPALGSFLEVASIGTGTVFDNIQAVIQLSRGCRRTLGLLIASH